MPHLFAYLSIWVHSTITSNNPLPPVNTSPGTLGFLLLVLGANQLLSCKAPYAGNLTLVVPTKSLLFPTLHASSPAQEERGPFLICGSTIYIHMKSSTQVLS